MYGWMLFSGLRACPRKVELLASHGDNFNGRVHNIVTISLYRFHSTSDHVCLCYFFHDYKVASG